MTPRPPVSPAAAAALLRRGGIVIHPTEAVWGLACDPASEAAVQCLLALKQRTVDKGLILVAGTLAQLDALVDWSRLPPARREAVIASWPGPHTWIMPAAAGAPAWIRGSHAGVAVRLSAHPPVVALCAAFGGTLVSTSANRAGAPPPRTLAELDPAIHAGADAILAGTTGGHDAPSTIHDALTGTALR